MLKINNGEFDIKYMQLDLRQRMYENKSIVTVIMHIDFYPTMVNEQIVYGGIEVKVDMDNIHSLRDLENKVYEGDIGNINISLCNDGIWENKLMDTFKVSFGVLKGRMMNIDICGKDFSLNEIGTFVSLYTTNTNLDILKKEFSLDDFYLFSQENKIGNSSILKFYVRL